MARWRPWSNDRPETRGDSRMGMEMGIETEIVRGWTKLFSNEYLTKVNSNETSTCETHEPIGKMAIANTQDILAHA